MFFAAYNASVRINGNTLIAKKWEVNNKADKLDVSNFEGGGFKEYIGGMVDCDVSIEFDWYGTAGGNPFDAPLSILPSTALTNVRLYVNGTAGPFWSFPSFFVESVTNTADTKQQMTLRVTGSSTGTFTDPTGAAV